MYSSRWFLRLRMKVTAWIPLWSITSVTSWSDQLRASLIGSNVGRSGPCLVRFSFDVFYYNCDCRSARRVYVDIEFSVMRCEDCRETFTFYYYPSSSNVASSTFPPWRENPFIKVDTVAAGERFDSGSVGPGGINKKTLVIGPLTRWALNCVLVTYRLIDLLKHTSC